MSDLREAVRAHTISVVICYALDRLSRNQAHIYIVAEELDEVGARLEFVTESFEDSAVGRMIRSAKAFAAEVEHEKIKERTARGRLARAQAGSLIPGWKPLFGYAWADETKSRYAIDAQTSAVVRRIFSETLTGIPRRELARQLSRDGIPTPSGQPSVETILNRSHSQTSRLHRKRRRVLPAQSARA